MLRPNAFIRKTRAFALLRSLSRPRFAHLEVGCPYRGISALLQAACRYFPVWQPHRWKNCVYYNSLRQGEQRPVDVGYDPTGAKRRAHGFCKEICRLWRLLFTVPPPHKPQASRLWRLSQLRCFCLRLWAELLLRSTFANLQQIACKHAFALSLQRLL